MEIRVEIKDCEPKIALTDVPTLLTLDEADQLSRMLSDVLYDIDIAQREQIYKHREEPNNAVENQDSRM